jgi:hypothetical protein
VRTTLTPEFWRLFATLLGAAMVATFVAALVFDELALRLLRRRALRRQSADPTRRRQGRAPQAGAGRHGAQAVARDLVTYRRAVSEKDPEQVPPADDAHQTVSVVHHGDAA